LELEILALSSATWGKGLAVVVVAYNMYLLERCKGKLNPEWKIEKPLDFWHFREKLSEQMLEYKPAHCVHPGDQNMRVSTQHIVQNITQALIKPGPHMWTWTPCSYS
jgi:hypothetical protein